MAVRVQDRYAVLHHSWENQSAKPFSEYIKNLNISLAQRLSCFEHPSITPKFFVDALSC